MYQSGFELEVLAYSHKPASRRCAVNAAHVRPSGANTERISKAVNAVNVIMPKFPKQYSVFPEIDPFSFSLDSERIF